MLALPRRSLILPLIFVIVATIWTTTLPAQAPVAPTITQQFFDESGIIASGFKLCSYSAGTTTPLSTYSDSGLSVPNTNPIILSAAGRITTGLYLSPVNYKFIFMSPGSDSTCATGNVIWTRDQVPSIGLLTSAAGLATGTPSTTTFLRGDMTWAKPWTVVTSTSTGTLNDFAPGLVGNTIVRMNNATLATITGLAGGFDGQRVIVQSVGAGQVDEAHATSAAGLGSLAQDRLINFATSGNTSEAAGSGVAEYVYDGTATRWRLVAHEQGAWITPTYASGNFTTNGAGGWTVDAGDVLAYAYRLQGRSLTVMFTIDTTSVVAATGTLLKIAVPGGFTSTKNVSAGLAFLGDNSASSIAGFAHTSAGATLIDISRFDSGAFTASANNSYVRGEVILEVS